MRLTRRSARKLFPRTVAAFLLAMFLQWAGMPSWPNPDGTIYAEIARLVGASPHGARAGWVSAVSPFSRSGRIFVSPNDPNQFDRS